MVKYEQNRKKEEAKRKSYYDKVEKRKAKEDEYDTKKQDECKTFPVDGSDCPFNAPMHYFWEKIPKTDWPLIGERLNTNVKTLGIPVRPQNKNPLSSKDTFTKDNGGNSVIIASPKKMMRPVAQGQSGEYPHLLLTTGACTHPNYNFGDLGFMAKRDHTYGFAVVDVLDDKIHLTRIVSAQKNGTFVDLGIKYQEGKEPEKVKTVALVVGDSHFAEINPKVDKANVQMMQALEPKHTHLNDIFAALSINIHEVDDPIRRNRMKKAHTNSLEEELYFAGKYLTRNAKIAGEWGGEIVVNFSNHDDMIYRWLATEKYRTDDENICGHVHQLEILRNAISVGTSTKIPLEYQIGNPSTSMSGNAAIYEGGIVQAIPIIKGLFAKAKTLEFLMRNKI